MGFDMIHKDEVFKPFHKIYPEYEGIGMGMAICKKIIDRHEGMIDVESEIGRGTKFYIRLPEKPLGDSNE
jgi:signal transduction histidine kinase